MRNIGIILAGLFAGLLVSCGAKKSVNKTAVVEHQKEQMAFERLVQTQKPPKQAIASAVFELSQGGKTVRSKAEIAIIADSCIQISVRPLLGIEVFRAGIMPNGVILLDRLNGQFCRVGEDELNQYGGMSTRQFYNLVQSAVTGVAVGWDFLPLKKSDRAHYHISFEDAKCTLLTQQGVAEGYKQTFLSNRLSESLFCSAQIGIELLSEITYSDKDTSVDSPEKCVVKGRNLKGKEQVKLELSNFKMDRKPSINLQIPKSYQSKTLMELIESIH